MPETRCIEADPAAQRARDVVTYAAWGDGLELAQFLVREERLRATPYARRAMRSYLLVEAEGPQRTLASLETFEMSSVLDGREGRSFQIASVFTEPALRGRGHASALVAEVVERVMPRAQAVTLYSDVGEPLYAKLGFAALPAFDWSWPAARDAAPGVARAEGQPAVELALASWPIRGELRLPSGFDQIDWHRERERAYGALLGRRGVAHGVLTTDGGGALLAGDLKHGCLCVLAWWALDAGAAQRLAIAAADEAALAGLNEVRAWAAAWDDEPAIAAGLDRVHARRSARDGALPMIRGPHARAWRDVCRAQWV